MRTLRLYRSHLSHFSNHINRTIHNLNYIIEESMYGNRTTQDTETENLIEFE